jgi:hypothetical protein
MRCGRWAATWAAGRVRRPPSVSGAGPRDPLSRRDHAEKLDILRKADAIYIEEIRRPGLYDTIWQAFAVLLPVKTVGVMGDGRTYDYVVGLRAVTSTDGMTADFYPFDMRFLGATATRIINEVKGVNRVVYDVTASRPARSSGNDAPFLSSQQLCIQLRFKRLNLAAERRLRDVQMSCGF